MEHSEGSYGGFKELDELFEEVVSLREEKELVVLELLEYREQYAALEAKYKKELVEKEASRRLFEQIRQEIRQIRVQNEKQVQTQIRTLRSQMMLLERDILDSTQDELGMEQNGAEQPPGGRAKKRGRRTSLPRRGVPKTRASVGAQDAADALVWLSQVDTSGDDSRQ